MTLELHATSEEVMRAVEAWQNFGRLHQVGERVLFGLSLAIEECGSNIVNHALQRDLQKSFHMMVEYVNRTVTIELRDEGPEFDPTLAREVKDATAEDDDRPPGGWGIELVRRYTDEIRYSRQGGQNILCLIKIVDPPVQDATP